MKKKTVVLSTENYLFVDLTFHDVPAMPLTEFAVRIVRPYYSGNMNEALRDLFWHAIREEDFVLSRIKSVERGDHG